MLPQNLLILIRWHQQLAVVSSALIACFRLVVNTTGISGTHRHFSFEIAKFPPEFSSAFETFFEFFVVHRLTTGSRRRRQLKHLRLL
jgi:hypothetical protein